MTTKKKPPSKEAAAVGMTVALAIFDRFKELADVKPIPITCKGWGLVYALPMTVADAEIAQAEPREELLKNANAKAVMRVMCDAEGKRVFDLGNPEHLALVLQQPQDCLVDFLSKVSYALGVSEEGEADAKKG